MSKVISSTKIALSENEVRNLGKERRGSGVICSDYQLTQLRRFVNFTSIIYSYWWATCCSSLDAPYNDLYLYKSLLMYREVDKVVADSAIKAFFRHRWYLTGEWVVLSLFSEKVPIQQKEKMRTQLIKSQVDALRRNLPGNFKNTINIEAICKLFLTRPIF